ncbi:MAG: hypothetical protein M1819_000601 [Sarea resinae]|nr:MAG: hypothetical protein M1819_000601 [Sarea resinae]
MSAASAAAPPSGHPPVHDRQPDRKLLFFEEDICALATDPDKIGRTWHDVDGQGSFSDRDEIWRDDSVLPASYLEFLATGLPPRDHVVIHFLPMGDISIANLLILESQLVLIDRPLSFGDIVRRHDTDSMNGTVIRTSVSCLLTPAFPKALADGSMAEASMPPDGGLLTSKAFNGLSYSVDDGTPKYGNFYLHDVPSEELERADQYREGTFIIYDGWLGKVEETVEEVTIRLRNGSVVAVENADELEFPFSPDATEKPHDPMPVGHAVVGDFVSTKKGNLRRGLWKFGAYDPSIPPQGYVLEVRTVELAVHWIFHNLLTSSTRRLPTDPPPSTLDHAYLDSGNIKAYDRSVRPSSQLEPKSQTIGSSAGSTIDIGDQVRFRDLTGACVKYDGESYVEGGWRQGKLVKIPRSFSQGYDINYFSVVSTKTKVAVLWQDLSITEENSIDIAPCINTDDFEVWPGDIVVTKESRSGETDPLTGSGPTGPDGVFQPKKVGIVQSVDSKERIAQVRWYVDPTIELVGDSKSILLPGARTGPISEDVEGVSCYEIMTSPALNKRRGDFVLVVPGSLQTEDDGHENTDPAESTANNTLMNLPRRILDQAREFVMSGGGNMLFGQLLANTAIVSQNGDSPSQSRNVPQLSPEGSLPPGLTSGAEDLAAQVMAILAQNQQGDAIDWFGEIVDLGLDGRVTVRFGALEEVRDVHVPPEMITAIFNPDDPDGDSGYFYSDTESDGWSDAMSGLVYDSDDVIEEIIEYEGGTRLDGDGGDEMWLTDEDGEDAEHAKKAEEASDVSMANSDVGDVTAGVPKVQGETDAAAETSTLVDEENHPASKPLSSGPVAPPAFQVLESDPPKNHPFLKHTPKMSTVLMRRIQKEHKILQTSLPDGIFVRTWDSRIDLLRVLIVGPKKTPYEYAPFLIDFQFGDKFPTSPPDSHFHSWTEGIGRVNPNLYEDGKICLSLLGTWPADGRNESWSPVRSSMLQILVSIMGLVLVKEPYYNEAGFDVLVGTEGTRATSAQYTEKAYVLSRGFITFALRHTLESFDDVKLWLYISRAEAAPRLLDVVLNEAKEVIKRSEAPSTSEARVDGETDGKNQDGIVRVSAGALVLLRKQVTALEEFQSL